jgi:cytochrome c556
MRHPALLLTALLTLALTGCGEPADTRPGQPVTQRRAAFKKILLAFEPMGIQLREKQYNPDQFIVLAEALTKVKDGPWSHFGPDTNYPPSHAKAKVWTEAERFASDRQVFLQSIDRLLVVAASRDEKQINIAYETVHDSCRSCHKAFKD